MYVFMLCPQIVVRRRTALEEKNGGENPSRVDVAKVQVS
jgi:hypothetical protein